MVGRNQMAAAEQQMPRHVEAAYKDAVDNIIFLKRFACKISKLKIKSPLQG
jgi:hypothetical protein